LTQVAANNTSESNYGTTLSTTLWRKKMEIIFYSKCKKIYSNFTNTIILLYILPETMYGCYMYLHMLCRLICCFCVCCRFWRIKDVYIMRSAGRILQLGSNISGKFFTHTGCPKMTSMLFFPKISITNGTFSAKFYTHVYSTKIHMLTSIQSMITFLSTRDLYVSIKIFNLMHIK